MNSRSFFRAIRTQDFDTITWCLIQPNRIIYMNALDENNETPLDVALSHGANRGVVDALLRAGVYVTVDNILHAARLPNREVLPWLCNSGRGITNRPNTDGWNPLQLALENLLGAKVLLALLNNGANPRLTDPNGWTALPMTIFYYRNHPSVDIIISALLERGADPNDPGRHGSTPLHLAIKINPSSSIILSLLKHGADPNALNPDGRTVLYSALYEGVDMYIIYLLVVSGADVDIRDEKGFTVLHKTMANSKRRNINFIRCLLVFASADCNARTRNGSTALHLYARSRSWYGRNQTIMYSVSDPDRNNDIDLRIGDGTIVSALVHSGANINSLDDSGKTPLYYSVYNKDQTRIEELLRNGADPNVSDRNRNFPIHFAIKFYDIEITETLLRAGANANARNAQGCTPLHAAAVKDWRESILVETLIQHNCNVNLRDNDGATALHRAVTKGISANIKALLNANANLNIQDENGCTPLHCAILASHRAALVALESLLRAGVDMRTKDRYGRTALHLALIVKAELDIIYLLVRWDPTQFKCE